MLNYHVESIAVLINLNEQLRKSRTMDWITKLFLKELLYI